MRPLRTGVTAIALLACLAMAAAPKPPHSGGGGAGQSAARAAPQAPATPRVVLTLTDGKSISGEFVDVSPAGMTLRQGPKSDPVLTPWSSIKSASNKMTHAAVVSDWQKNKREQLCDTCEGNGATTCPTCEGTGVDPAQKQSCQKCEGTGSLGKCKTPNCVEGMIPRPDKCLKAESFTGVEDADGKRWREFKSKAGTARVSDFHVGQRMLLVDGKWQLEDGKCPTCGGATRVKDTACAGTGKQICKDCKGHGVIGPDCTACDDGQAKCATCGGTGLKASATPAASPAPDAPATPER